MTRRLLTVIVFMLCGIGCESPVHDAKVEYVERLVIRGVLTPGSLVSGVYVGRTLPVTSIPNPADAQIPDATVVLITDGIPYPLHHTSDGLYGSTELLLVPGRIYELQVEWHGLRAVARSLVPRVPDSASVTLVREAGSWNTYVCDAGIIPQEGEVYGAVMLHPFLSRYGINDSTYLRRYVETSRQARLYSVSDIRSDGRTHIQMREYLTNSFAAHDTVTVTISAFDEQYYAYYNSSSDLTSFEDIVLGMTPTGAAWNVSGDGIGIFIGRASVSKEFLLR